MNWTSLIDSNKIGGWVRAGVAAGLGLLVGKFPGLSGILDPATQQVIGVAVAAVVVGAWSQLTKTDAAKVAAVVELTKDPNSPVQGVITTNDEAGQKLAASIPGPVESAGSASAVAIAKS